MRNRADSRGSRALARFLRTESAGGVVMLGAAAMALLLANSPLADAYERPWHAYAGLSVGAWSLQLSLLHWVNDGLMALFFFVVGLEIKRELLFGELAAPRRAALPVVAAVGGAVLPAGIFLLLNAGGQFERGWGIPMATDIAFAVTVLALLGARAPLWLKAFVTALAIADDIVAVLVIALFYSGQLHAQALMGAAAVLLVLLALNRGGVQRSAWYAVPAILLWYAVLQSGVHATIAGVVAAAFIPASRPRPDSRPSPEISASIEASLEELESPAGQKEEWETRDIREEALTEIVEEATGSSAALYRIERALHPWVSFFVLPLFAFANAGIPLSAGAAHDALTNPMPLGIILGLLLGKQLGITGASWMAVRLRVGNLPAEARWSQLWGGSLIAGIGFTMSIFIASLAFGDPEVLEMAKLAVVVGSVLSAAAGIAVLAAGRRPALASPGSPERAGER